MCYPPFTADSNVNFWSSVLPSSTYSLIGSSRLRKRVHNGPSLNLGVSDPSLLGPTPSSMIPKMSCTCSECITIVVVPAAVASSAAINFVDIPPVPSDVPKVEVDTERDRRVSLGDISVQWQGSPCCRTFCISLTTLTGLASGLFLGLSVYLRSVSCQDLFVTCFSNLQTPHIGEKEQIICMNYG